MNTSTLYIRAAEQGIFDARASHHQLNPPSTYSLGIEAVRNCGYKHRRVSPALIHKGRGPIATACYLLASIPDAEVLRLLTIINPSIPVSICTSSLMQAMGARLGSYYEGVSEIKEDTKRKIAEIVTDILLSYSYSMVMDQLIHSEHELQDRTRALVSTQEMVSNALGMADDLAAQLRKRDVTIEKLLELLTEAEDSRACREESRSRTEKVIDKLPDQLGLKKMTSSLPWKASRPTSSENKEEGAGSSNVAMLIDAAYLVESSIDIPTSP